MKPNINYDKLKKHIIEELCNNCSDNETTLNVTIALDRKWRYTLSLFIHFEYEETCTRDEYFNSRFPSSPIIKLYSFDISLFDEDKEEYIKLPFFNKLKEDIYNEYNEIISE